jgi:cell shape-determining protein MreC
MKYHSGREDRAKRRYVNFGLGFVAFALFIYFWTPFRGQAYPLVEPLMRAYSSSKISAFLVPEFLRTYVSSRKSLEQKNKDLEAAIERMENQLAEKNGQIRELSLVSSLAAPGSNPVIVMYPIAEDITKIYSTVLLSKGYKDGVESGSIAYLRGMQPACEILEVYDTTSLCELLSKSGRLTEGVTSSSSVLVMLEGQGGGNFIAHVPKATTITPGEEVLMRSNQAYVLGTVVSVEEEQQATGAKVYVRGSYNPVHSSLFYLQASHVH